MSGGKGSVCKGIQWSNVVLEEKMHCYGYQEALAFLDD